MNINTILKRNPRPAKYGAPMGAQDDYDGGPLYLQRVQFVDGDYAPDGTYWGGGRGTEPLYCAFNEHSRVYVRAKSRKIAQAAVLEQYEDAEFIEKFDMQAMVDHYITTALWSTFDEPPPNDRVPKHQRLVVQTVCAMFIAKCEARGVPVQTLLDATDFGHNFWLARNRAGVGFSDRRGDAKLLALCDEIARSFCETHCYTARGGWVYFE